MKLIFTLGLIIISIFLLVAVFFLDIDQLLKYAPLATFTLGLLAFSVAIRTYYRKSDIKVKAYFITNRNSHYGKSYIQSYYLESEKDKAIIIFRTYLKLGFDTYILLEDFRDSPIILKAYEIHHKEFGRLHWYTSNEYKLDLTDLLNDPKIEKRIVLSTSQGKYIAEKNCDPWYAETSKVNYNLIHGQYEPNIQGYASWKDQDFRKIKSNHISKNAFTFVLRLMFKKVNKILRRSEKDK